jgi:hypothetical protein
MSAINEEMTFVSRDCKSILDICDKISKASEAILGNDKTRLLASDQLSGRLKARDHDSELYAAARLRDVPVLARVGCKDDSHRTRTFYVCPCPPPQGIPRANLGSVYSPLGRLAVLPLGGTLVTAKGESLTVTDRATLRPSGYASAKDVHDSLFESVSRDRVRVKSLRDFVRTFGENKPKLADETGDEPPLVPAEELDVVIDEGESRLPARSHALALPPLLDLAQDEVLRRPFGTPQFIVGPPGSGKTVTLVRRLDFMITREALEAEAPDLPDRLAALSSQPHQTSWYLFVPTDGERRYLRDAFAELVIPGFDKNALTWEEARLDLAANHFRILAPGGLRLAKPSGRVAKAAGADPVGWYTDFASHQAKAFSQAQRAQARFLLAQPDQEVADLGQRLTDALAQSSDHSLSWHGRALAPFQAAISDMVAARTETLSRELRAAFQGHVDRDPTLIEGLVALQAPSGRAQGEGGPGPSQNPFRREAYRIYSSALLDHATALAKGKALPRDSRSGRVLGWLGEGRLLPQARLRELGADRVVVKALRRFKTDCPSFHNAYFDSIVPNYLRFRRHNRLWYTQAAGASRLAEPPEIDLLLLAFLEAGAGILKGAGPAPAGLNWSLDNQAYLCRNQVLVDGASGFSPVQLKCMASLASPALGSVTAAADLGATPPANGLQSLDDVEWAMPQAVVTELAVNYRQSPQLLGLTDLLSGASKPRFSSSRFESKGPRPALGQNLGPLPATAAWLTDRLSEIASRSGPLPTTAVALAKPSDVGPMAEALSRALAADPERFPDNPGLRALASRPGQPLGLSGDVRVLSLDEARGLEFEAFFLVAPDGLTPADLPPADLYLAAGRAVTYLGLAFRSALPADLDNLSRLTVPSWSQPQETFAAVSL